MNDNEKYIEEFVKDVPFDASEGGHRDALKKQLLSAYPKHRLQPTAHTVGVWRIIMNKRIIKLAAAAAIIIAVGIFFWGNGGDSVAWAQLIEHVEKIKTVVYRMKVTMKGMPGLSEDETMEIDMQAKFVYDQAFYIDGCTCVGKERISTKTYVLFDEGAMVMVMPEQKKYLKLRLTDDLLEKMEKDNGDPRSMLKEMMKHEYTKLGLDTINGIEVEGIEVTDPAMGGGMFDQLVARLWVDVETDLPVLMTMKASTNDAKVILDMVMDDYNWDAEIDPEELKPNIPDDYELLADAEFGIDSDGKGIVEVLKFFADFADGRYPSSLTGMTVTKEFSEALIMKFGGRMPLTDPNEQEIANILKLQSIGMTYAMMVKDGNDPAYYGDKVTAQFPHAVLMRWKIADDTYRVIFGDLAIEDVSPEKLAELEATPLNLNPYPVNPDPADGTVGTDLKGLKLSWIIAAYATKHKVYFGTSAEKMSLLSVVEGSNCNKVPVLRRDTTYYWRVDAIHTDGSIEAGDVWSFNTGGLVGWSKSEFAGTQEDLWYIEASGDISVRSDLTLLKGPEGTNVIPISLPYADGELTSVTLDEVAVPFRQMDKGRYELELPLEKLFTGQTKIICKWTLSLDMLEKVDKVDYGYRTVLKSLMPVVSYKLRVSLAPDSGFEFTKDTSKKWIVPFTFNAPKPHDHFGSCGIQIRKRD